MALFVFFGGCAIGCLFFLSGLMSMSQNPGEIISQRDQAKIMAVISLVFYGMAGWVLSRLLEGIATLIDLHIRQIEAADRLEAHLLQTLQGLRAAPAAPPAENDPRRDLAAIRRAIKEGEWALADELIRAFGDDFPDHPKIAELLSDLNEARQAAAADLRAKIVAAREAHDPNRVLDLRQALRPLLPGESLRALDQELVPWFMALIQQRLRVIPIQAEVVLLAGRAAEQFDDTREGASLRAALPTLRRSVGLCPRCGAPYLGIDNACPQCLGTPPAPRDGPADPPVAPRLEPPAIIPVDPGDDDGLSARPSDELEDFRKFLDPPT